MNFDEAFERLLGHEGELSLDPKDRGNWTGGEIGRGELRGSKYGISAAAYPDLDIANLTKEQAKAITVRDYWLRHGLDQLPPAVRFDVFDAVFNSGPGYRPSNPANSRDGGIRWLQRAARVDDDGVMGAKTAAACAGLNAELLLRRFNGERLLFLSTKMRRDTWDSQGRGLVARVARNLVA